MLPDHRKGMDIDQSSSERCLPNMDALIRIEAYR